MKKSNFVLSIITAVALLTMAAAYTLVLPQNGTSVLMIPSDTGTVGSGLKFKIPPDLTDRQIEILGMAYSIAKKDGHEHPQLLQGIVLQESKAGDIASYKVAGQEFGLKVNERYYGVAQIKLAAAKDVLSKYPNMMTEFNFHTKTDEEVIAKLIENDSFNLSVASKYLLILKSLGYTTIKQLSLAYNQGPGGAKNQDASSHYYPKGVMAYVQKLSVRNDKQ